MFWIEVAICSHSATPIVGNPSNSTSLNLTGNLKYYLTSLHTLSVMLVDVQ